MISLVREHSPIVSLRACFLTRKQNCGIIFADMANTLLVGIGNVDREDDGVAWHLLRAIAARWGYSLPNEPDEINEFSFPQADLYFDLQLIPETAETLAKYSRVCILDAHTGAVPDEIHFEVLEPFFQASPLTHHLTPQSCLSLAETIFNGHPEGVLVSVRGYQFGFNRTLSERTAALIEPAVEQILQWLERTPDQEKEHLHE